MIVLDASAAVEWVLNTVAGRRVATRLSTAATVHAPHLIDLEVASVLRRLELTSKLTRERSAQALDNFCGLDLIRAPHDVFLPRIWQLRGNLTPYDACYVALAEALNAPLVTCDGPLANTPGNRARIELV